MWLDRFSNAPTSQSSTPNRGFSPSPRKSNHPSNSLRNGLGIGLGRSGSTSSVDLATSPTSSTVSLPLPQRRSTGSALRQEQKPPPDAIDPSKVLRSILGLQGKQNDDPKDEEHQRSADGGAPIVEVDFSGMSLQEFATSAPQQEGGRPLGEGVTQDDRKGFEDFHSLIRDTDEILDSVESYLAEFKAELGEVSAEIENLQARSVQLNTQLDNRRKVEKLLGPAVQDIILSPKIVRAIAEGPVDEQFAKALTEIEARHMTVNERSKGDTQTKAAEDVKPLLNDLKTRVIERIRDYLVAQIKALRAPNVNAQVVQQQTLLRHKELYPFLTRNHPQLAEEIGRAYTNTMRWYYSSNFTRYNNALNKLQLYTIEQTDLLGSEPSSRKPNVLGASKSNTIQNDVFNLGRRADYLNPKDDRSIPSYLAEDSKAPHHLEIPFRNFNQALLDNLTAEYIIITELFSTSSYQQVSRRVLDIFDPTFSLGHTLTKSLIETTTDCLGILLCIRLTQKYAFEAQRRKIPVMDAYLNYNNILLWPRFQKIMDFHAESLKRIPVPSNRGAAAAFSLVGGGGSDASKASVTPHAVTQRFGQFLHGILTLSAEAGDDEPLAHSLSRLRGEYEALMVKLAKGAGDAVRRARFLYNNYSLVLTIISDATGKLAEEQKDHLSDLVKEYKGN